MVAGGHRDSYQVPIALYEARQLSAFVTDLYVPLDNRAMRLWSCALPASITHKFKLRYSPNLPSRFVKSCALALLKSAGENGWMGYNKMLGEHAGKLAARQNCGIVSYAHLATGAFEHARNLPKVLLQMQPHPVSVRDALRSDELLPDLRESKVMNELRWPQPVFDMLCREPLLADWCIAASSYSRQSLIDHGVNPNRISVVPYGVDVNFFTPAHSTSGPFTVLFVGQPVRQKGIHYLLEAWRRLKFPNAELRIAGKSSRGNLMLSRFSSEFTYRGVLDWNELREEYRHADLVCLPSLSEGFGLVTLESLACGTPVVATTAAGSSEILSEGVDGFVIEAANLESLMAAFESAYSDRRRLREMGRAARIKAEKFPWIRFRQSIREAVENSVMVSST